MTPKFVKFIDRFSRKENLSFVNEFSRLIKEKSKNNCSVKIAHGDITLKPKPICNFDGFNIWVEGESFTQSWQMIFWDTIVPYVEIEMFWCNPPPLEKFSLEMSYTELLLHKSFAHMAFGLGRTFKIGLAKYALSFVKSLFFLGRERWIYLALKTRTLPSLSKEVQSRKVDTGKQLLRLTEEMMIIDVFEKKSIRVSQNNNAIKEFLEEIDSRILEALGRDILNKRLKSMEIDLEEWSKYIFPDSGTIWY